MRSTVLPRLNASTPLHYARRPRINPEAVSTAVEGSDLGLVARLIGPAILAADHHAVGLLGPIALSHEGVPQAASIGHERLIVATAGSFAGNPPATVGGLGAFARVIAGNVSVVRMSLDLGATHRIRDLEKSFVNAETRATEFVATADAVAAAGSGPVSLLARALGFFGRLDVAEPLARAALATDQPWPAVTLAATYRHLFHASAKNIELNGAVLALNPTFTPALNSICAAHVDLGDPAAGIEYLLRSLAIDPDRYAGNTGWRAFRVVGRSVQSDRCAAIAHSRATGQVAPGPWRTVDAYCRWLAHTILVTEGRDDLAQTSLHALSMAALVGNVSVRAVLDLIGSDPVGAGG